MADKREVIEHCLLATKNLRSSVSQVFEDFVSNSVGKVDVESSDAVKSSEFFNGLKQNFVQVQKSVSNLEKAAGKVIQIRGDPGAISLGNTGLLSLDPGEDKTPLYRQLIGTYNWNEKLLGQSQQAFSSLKRNHPCSAKRNEDGSTKRTRFAGSSAKSDMERLFQFLRQKHPNLRFIVFKVCGAHLLEITIPRTLKAMIILRGFGIEQVMIRGIDEAMLNDQKENIHTPSKHAVFKKLTAYATSAMLHYYTNSDTVFQVINFVSPLVAKGLQHGNESTVVGNEKTGSESTWWRNDRKPVPWLHLLETSAASTKQTISLGPNCNYPSDHQKWLDTFQALFSKKCTKCGFHLKEDEEGCPLPPCWRAYDTLQPYHYSCYTQLLN